MSEESKSNPDDQEVEDEEEEYEDENHYVDDGFINDEEEDSVQSSPKAKKKNSRKRKRKVSHPSEDQLDEDDLDIINAGKSKKGRKRLKKAIHKETDDANELKDEAYDDENNQADEFIEGENDRQIAQDGVNIYSEKLDQMHQIFGSDSEEDVKDDKDKKVTKNMPDEIDDDSMGLERNMKIRNEILKADIPERLYTRLSGRMDPTDEELDAEALWIFKTKDKWRKFGVTDEDIISSIKSVLKYIRKDKFDVPFLATYR